MTYKKLYVICTVVIIAAIFFVQGSTKSEAYGTSKLAYSSLKDEVFARSINEEKRLSIKVDGAVIPNQFYEVLVGDDRDIMLSIDFLRDKLDLCAFTTDDDTALVIYNDNEYTLEALRRGEIDYVSALDVCAATGFGVDADLDELSINITTGGRASTLPVRFDLRRYGKAPEVMDQGKDTTCWAYASVLALESVILPHSINIDVNDMIRYLGEQSSDADAGGAYTNALAYLLSWNGPVSKNDSTIVLSGNDADEVAHVQEARFYTHSDEEAIKWAVYRFGGVSTSIFANVSNTNLSTTSYYDRSTNSYCYPGDRQPNHEITIIGWDDDYDASNFAVSVPGDGAFICQNSWGKSFGDDGVFYVSYYDSNIGAQAVSYSRVMSPSYYNNIYQSDLSGWKGQLGYGLSSALAANIYTARNSQKLEAVGLYAVDKDADIDVYVVCDYSGIDSLSKRKLVASRHFDTTGYYTIELDKPIALKSGRKFAVVVDVNVPQTYRPIAVEYRAGELDDLVDIADGEGYISKDGVSWESVEDKVGGNLCIKAYTNNVGK